jgi:hypothetical protein
MSTPDFTTATGTPPSAPVPESLLPPTRLGRYKRWIENNGPLATVIIICIALSAVITFVKDVRDFALPFLRPRIDAMLGPRLVFDYKPSTRNLTLTLPVLLRITRSNSDVVFLDQMELNSAPKKTYTIYFSGPALACKQAAESRRFPFEIQAGQSQQLDCSLSQQLSDEAENFLLTPGYLCLTLKFHGQRSRAITKMFCYYNSQSCVTDARFTDRCLRNSANNCKNVAAMMRIKEKEQCKDSL